MPKSYRFTAINPQNERVHNRRSAKRTFIKDDFKLFVKNKKILSGEGVGAIALRLIDTGEPITVKGWTLMIETEEKTNG